MNNSSVDNKTVKFVYKYKSYDETDQEVEMDITIPFEECLEEYVTKLMNKMDPVMRYSDTNVGK